MHTIISNSVSIIVNPINTITSNHTSIINTGITINNNSVITSNITSNYITTSVNTTSTS